MERRKFIYDIFKVTIAGSVMIVLPSTMIAEQLNVLSLDPNFKPYMFDVNEISFKTLLDRNPMPKAVKRKAIQMTPDKAIWLIGEGRDNLKHSEISNKISDKNGYTPVHEIYGVKGGHTVFGQWYEIRPNDIRGVIRGFDKQFYSVYHNFMNIFTNKYNCYGLPSDNYIINKCSCGEQYVYQDFKTSCDSSNIRLYAWYNNCKLNSNGTHIDINKKIKQIEPCGTNDNFDIGAAF